MRKFLILIALVLLLTLPLCQSFVLADSNSSTVNFAGSSLSLLDYATGFYNNSTFSATTFNYVDFRFNLNDTFKFSPYLFYYNIGLQLWDNDTVYYVQLPGSYNVTSFAFGEPIFINGSYPKVVIQYYNKISKD